MAQAEESGVKEIDDPSEYKQKRRIKSILDAREHVLEQRRRALDLQAEGLIGAQMANKMLREAVEAYIIEVENKVRESDHAIHYWGDVDDSGQREGVFLGSLHVPERNGEREFIGLRDIMTASDPLTFEYTVKRSDELEGTQTETRRTEYQIPEDVLLAAFRAINEFLNEVGMDADFEEDELPTFGYETLEDYDDDA